jgi:ankyrin repeat protein
MAQWMIANGSDVHQGGDAPLMRAALSEQRIPMMELLIAHGADVNAAWHGSYPILFAACETLNPGGTLLHIAAEFQSLSAERLLLDRGADVNAAATLNDAGVGGQTPIFHAATQRQSLRS